MTGQCLEHGQLSFQRKSTICSSFQARRAHQTVQQYRAYRFLTRLAPEWLLCSKHLYLLDDCS